MLTFFATYRVWRMGSIITLGLFAQAFAGCNHSPPMAPVHGKVLYQGKPLEFGSIILQPDTGPPASSTIRPDGSFDLSTFKPGDGAVVGRSRVRITAWEGQNPALSAMKQEGEQTLGKLLTPKKYSSFEQSGLTYDVKPSGNDNVVFELKDEPRRGSRIHAVT